MTSFSPVCARHRSLHALLLITLGGCFHPQPPALDEERVAQRVVALLRQQGLVMPRDADAGRPAADVSDAGAATDLADASAPLRPGRTRPTMPATTITPGVVTGVGVSRRVWVPIADAPSLGGAGALVTIVAFLDADDPACARLLPTLLAAREAHPADVRIVVRQHPLPGHPNAWGAAVLLLLARAQREDEGFFTALSYLYTEPVQRALDRASLDRHATALGLDAARLTEALDAPGPTDFDRALANDDAIAQSVPLGGPPAVLINGALVTDSLSRERLETLIAEETARARIALTTGVHRSSLYDSLARRAAP